MERSLLFFLIGSLMIASPAFAKIKVVTTLPSFADIAQNVGGDEVSVTPLTKGTQDPHFVDAKPDLILDLNKADLLIRAGLGLEDGWLPPLQTGSRNSRIQSGADGNLDVSSLIHLKEVPKTPLDRSMGDVHPGGNPHFMLDPNNGVILARGIADRLSKLDPSHAGDFRKRAENFSAALKKKIQAWKSALKPLQGKPVVTYHRSWVYFIDWAGLTDAGTVEPKPGIPPSPEHIVTLIHSMKERNVKLMVMEPFYPKGAAEQVATETGARLLVLPAEVKGEPDVKTYIDLFDTIVRKLTRSSP